MHDPLPVRLPRFIAGLLAAAIFAGPAAAQELREGDHKRIGDLIERYIEKGNVLKEAEKIRTELRSEFEKAGRKQAGKDGDAVSATLSMTADLEAITGMARSYKNLRGGKPEVRSVDAKGTKIEYTLLLPATYKASEGPYPLVLIAPPLKDGKQLEGVTFLLEYWTEAELRDTTVIAVVGMPEDTGTWNQLFVESSGSQRSLGGLGHLMTALRDITENVNIDPARVFAAGRGQGVGAVMSLGATFPQNLAGVIGQAGDCGKITWQNFRVLPVLLQGGGAEATAFVDEITKAGYGNATASPEVKGEEVQTWIKDHPRISNPTQVVLYPGSPIPNKAYWIEVPPTAVDEGTFVKAEIDRATNTVSIEGKGVPSVTVYFNDVLVDMDKPIKIVLNGQAQEVVVPRSLDAFLDLFVRSTSDPARIYVARRSFDLPQ